MRTDPPAVRWSAGIYRRLLFLYPQEFRHRYQTEMLRLFREQCLAQGVRRGVSGLALHWLGALRDLLINAGAERLAARRRPAGSVPPQVQPLPLPHNAGARMDKLREDIRYAFRTILRNPGFAAVVAITLGLGIGANTAIFSVVRGVLLRPLPYADPDRLAVVWTELTARNLPRFPVSPPDFRDYQDKSRLFERLAGVVTFPQPMTAPGLEPEQVLAGGVTQEFTSVLGVEPLLGRSFTADDVIPPPPGIQQGDRDAPPNMAMLSWGLWQRRFGGDPGVIGRTTEIGGTPTVIVGVMPRDFRLLAPPSSGLGANVDLWVALRLDFVTMPRNNAFLRVIGRLRPGVTVAQAQAEMDGVAAELRQINSAWETSGYRINVTGMHQDLTAHVRPMVLALL
ncbi:MAG TPA: ABC transporter permease, partial [Gemmatimonadales bacterium]|nr:ABC transporter permease [Gemmatimonadales bacterium]